MEDPQRIADFEAALKAWAGRPPRTAAPFAAQRLAARLAVQPRSRPLLTRALAGLGGAVAVAAAVALGALVVRSAPPAPSPVNPVNTANAGPAPLDEGVVVLWLDRETPLYLTLTPPHAEKGGPS